MSEVVTYEEIVKHLAKAMKREPTHDEVLRAINGTGYVEISNDIKLEKRKELDLLKGHVSVLLNTPDRKGPHNGS